MEPLHLDARRWGGKGWQAGRRPSRASVLRVQRWACPFNRGAVVRGRLSVWRKGPQRRGSLISSAGRKEGG